MCNFSNRSSSALERLGIEWIAKHRDIYDDLHPNYVSIAIFTFRPEFTLSDSFSRSYWQSKPQPEESLA